MITYVYIVGETVFLLSIYDMFEEAHPDEGDRDKLLREIELT